MPKVLKFEADWCQPCKAITLPLQQAAEETGTEVVPVNVEEDQVIAQQYRVNALPTLVLVDDEGVELNRVSGMRNRAQLLTFLGT